MWTCRGLVLAGHSLIPPLEFDSAFVTTHFKFMQGVGILEMPDAVVPEHGLRIDLMLVGLVERVDVAVRLHQRIGIFARGQGQAVVGTNEETALVIGGKATGNWEVGGNVMLFRNPRKGTQMGFRAKMRGSVGKTIAPFEIIEWILEHPGMTVDDLLASRVFNRMIGDEGGTGFGLSVNLAQTLNSNAGFQTSLEYRSGSSTLEFFDGTETVEASVHTNRMMGGFSIDADFEPFAPLALQFEYRYSLTLQETIEVLLTEDYIQNHLIGGGLYLLLRKDTLLGAAASYLMKVDDVQEQNFTSIQFIIQLFF